MIGKKRRGRWLRTAGIYENDRNLADADAKCFQVHQATFLKKITEEINKFETLPCRLPMQIPRAR
jgi:hypothetical protein